MHTSPWGPGEVVAIPQGPLEHLQMDFIQLLPSMGLAYVLVIAYPFADWVKTFLCRKTVALTVTGKLILFPTLGRPNVYIYIK